jgi:hypothetical protein
MALDNKICAQIYASCAKLKVTDISGAYNVDTNQTGWGNPNINTSDIEFAYLNITYANGATAQTNVLSSLPVTVTDSFLLKDININPLDGELIIEYQLITFDKVEYIAKIKIFSACLVRCCIDKMWAKYALSDVDCDCCKDTESRALQAEALYRAMMSSTACLNASVRNKLLAKLQRLCELEDCNCK